MSRLRWRKVWRDLWINKSRTMLVLMSIAIGVFAVGMMAGSRVILTRDLAANYAAINPAHATLYVESFGEDVVKAVRNIRAVAKAEGRKNVMVRFRVPRPDNLPADALWKDLTLIAVPDYDDMNINQPQPVRGVWPPDEQTVLIERASLDFTGVGIGETLVIETSGGKQRRLPVEGVVHDLTKLPPFLTNTAYGYITFDTLEWLGETREFDQLPILVAENAADKAHVQAVAGEVRDKIEKSGRQVYWVDVPEPGQHPAYQFINVMTLLMGALGLLSLVLSGFLVVNTISALLTRQIQQIGVMKALGARTGQIVRMYLTMVLIFGLLALLVAVPLGALGATGFTRLMATYLNFSLTNVMIPLSVFLLEIGVGLVVPVLAALYPVLAGSRVTVREAIDSYGLGKGQFGTRRLDQLLAREKIGAMLRRLSRPVLISLRNTFRRKGRLILTCLTLIMASAIFISVFSVRSSLFLTLDNLLTYWQYDIGVEFQRDYRIEELTREALRVPGVEQVEAWGFGGTRLVHADGSESGNIVMMAPPADTGMIQPNVVEGRWLRPDDEKAVVITTEILKKAPHIQVGDEIVFKIQGRETTWEVVGLARLVLPNPMVYVNYPYYMRLTNNWNESGVLQVVTERHDAGFRSEVVQRLEDHFQQIGLRVSSITPTDEIRGFVSVQFNIIIGLLLVMALIIGVVGALGLTGTMSINVLERQREIGVMRSIGASNNAVLKIVLVEGVLIGLLSWIVGILLALPLGYLLGYAVGIAFLQSPLPFAFSIGGALLWLGVVVILSAMASYWPARRASRLTIREVLAYE